MKRIRLDEASERGSERKIEIGERRRRGRGGGRRGRGGRGEWRERERREGGRGGKGGEEEKKERRGMYLYARDEVLFVVFPRVCERLELCLQQEEVETAQGAPHLVLLVESDAQFFL